MSNFEKQRLHKGNGFHLQRAHCLTAQDATYGCSCYKPLCEVNSLKHQLLTLAQSIPILEEIKPQNCSRKCKAIKLLQNGEEGREGKKQVTHHMIFLFITLIFSEPRQSTFQCRMTTSFSLTKCTTQHKPLHRFRIINLNSYGFVK